MIFRDTREHTEITFSDTETVNGNDVDAFCFDNSKHEKDCNLAVHTPKKLNNLKARKYITFWSMEINWQFFDPHLDTRNLI